ncbi:MAG: hypothetical protein HC857_00600 [Synechococcales cyanobacterium RU_4_20]|nr:hypothetical protein [Synechococcales cyanobacterium RU_4_20]
MQQDFKQINERLERLERICDRIVAQQIRTAQGIGSAGPNGLDPGKPLEQPLEDLPSPAKQAIALHQFLRSRPLAYAVVLLVAIGWGLPVILKRVADSGAQVQAITAMLPKGKPPQHKNQPAQRKRLQELKNRLGAQVVYLGEYYVDQDQGRVRLAVADDLWVSDEPHPSVLLPIPDAFEANAAGECHQSQELGRLSVELGITYLFACPIQQPGRLSVLGVGFLEAPSDRDRVQQQVTEGAQGLVSVRATPQTLGASVCCWSVGFSGKLIKDMLRQSRPHR